MNPPKQKGLGRGLEALLAATNIFIKEDGAWRLINHQASPVASAIAEQLEEAWTAPRGRLN